MSSHILKKLPNNTYEIVAQIPWIEVQKEYERAFIFLQKELTVEGFRKGKVPRTVAEKHIKKEAVYQQVIKDLIPNLYKDLITKEKLQPIVSPRVELVKAQENQPWEIKFLIAEKPVIELGDYSKIIKETKANLKKDEIWIPGKDKVKPDQKENNQKILNDILSALLTSVKCEISDIVIEEELNHRLSKLVTDIQKLGLTVEAYLKSSNLTHDQLKAKYTREIKDTYKLEFILNSIADKENIQVDKSDIDKLFSNIKSDKERKEAQANAYFYATLLRKQKTLDFLSSL